MATYPSSIYTPITPVGSDFLDNPDHTDNHINIMNEIVALQTKLGVDSSAVTTSIDYFLKHALGTFKTHDHTDEADIPTSNLSGTIATAQIADDAVTPAKINITAKARAYLNAAQNNLVNGTWTVVNLDTENYDIGNDFDTTNHKFVVPLTGYYLICGSVTFANPVVDKRYGVGIYHDTTQKAIHLVTVALSVGIAVPVSTILHLTASNNIYLKAKSDSGGDTVDLSTGDQNTYLAVHLLST